MSFKVARSARAKQKIATRLDLLEAAREQFTAAGVAKTNVGDVTRAAGVAHGTFYVHFANKDAIVRELVAELNTELARRIAAALQRGAARSLARTVRRIAGVFLDYWESERELIACVAERMIAGLSLADVRDGVNPPMAEMLARGLRELARERRVYSPQVDLLGHALLAMWLRIGLRHVFGDEPRKRTLDTLVGLTTAAIDAVLPPIGEGIDARVS